MNVFLNPSASEFKKLFKKTEKSGHAHNIVVDYDGEVLFDPQLQEPQLDLKKFKVKVHLSEEKFKTISRSERLHNLYNYLVDAFNSSNYKQRTLSFQ